MSVMTTCAIMDKTQLKSVMAVLHALLAHLRHMKSFSVHAELDMKGMPACAKVQITTGSNFFCFC